MEQYLKRKKLDKLQSQNILNKLSELKLLDDYAFAKRWVEGRRTLKPISRRRLIQELRAKRLDNETIEAALNEDDTDELDVLRQLVSKKMALSRYKADPLKLKQYLSRQGYSYEDIKSVMNSGND
jgi:regulatory protein